ncbi:hypothetical protein B0T24DRAFT_181973 [Lasiosphaeria ovina]|uniref:Uncharacterized protein n=1 Tax=Lasiosphaeria ovina TaxID=92902 RepID=A0AAE0TTQ6_9PEZI|nr:hypothetical protein B0T24DRAFT_181973 [Lasiosphaeria ovina]
MTWDCPPRSFLSLLSTIPAHLPRHLFRNAAADGWKSRLAMPIPFAILHVVLSWQASRANAAHRGELWQIVDSLTGFNVVLKNFAAPLTVILFESEPVWNIQFHGDATSRHEKGTMCLLQTQYTSRNAKILLTKRLSRRQRCKLVGSWVTTPK